MFLQVRAVQPEGDLTKATVKVAADTWIKLGPEQQRPFLEQAAADRHRYEVALTQHISYVASNR